LVPALGCSHGLLPVGRRPEGATAQSGPKRHFRSKPNFRTRRIELPSEKTWRGKVPPEIAEVGKNMNLPAPSLNGGKDTRPDRDFRGEPQEREKTNGFPSYRINPTEKRALSDKIRRSSHRRSSTPGGKAGEMKECQSKSSKKNTLLEEEI